MKTSDIFDDPGVKTGQGQLLRSINRGFVLGLIKERKSISRAEIAKITGLNKTTVSSQVTELIGKGIVHEIGTDNTEMGRKPVLLALDGGAGYVFGVGIAASSIRLVAKNIEGRTILETQFPLALTPTESSAEALVRLVAGKMNAARKSLSPTRYGLLGLGISVPGVVSAADQKVVRAGRFNWDSVELKPQFENIFACPVVVGNDAKLAATAEYAAWDERAAGQDSAKSCEDFLSVLIGDDIGLGAFLNGRPYRGPRGYFGEVGHMVIDRTGQPCSCGNRGCWNDYASESSLLARLATVSDRKMAGEGSLTLQEAAALWPVNSSPVQACFAEYADAMATGLVNLVNIFSPSAIIVNSELLMTLPELFLSIQNAVALRSTPFNRTCAIRLSRLGPQAPAVGAAMTALEGFFDTATLDPNSI